MFLYYLTQFLILNLTLNLKLTQKWVLLKTWKKIWKTWRNFEKMSGNPDKKTERFKAETPGMPPF